MDDIFLFAKTPLELENNTKQVLQRLKENDLFLKLGKCEFCKTKIEWLGMVIEEGRISMDPGKLKGISKWPSPATVKTNLGFPRIRKLLPKIHPSLLRNCQTPQWSSKERQKIWMDNRLSTGIWRIEKMFHGSTGLGHAWSYKTIPNRVRHVQIRYRSSVDPIGFEWRPSPMRVHFKDLFPHEKKLWNLWSRTLGNNSSIRRMVALHSGLPSYNDNLIRSQKFDILPGSTKTELKTSTLVTLFIRIRC